MNKDSMDVNVQKIKNNDNDVNNQEKSKSSKFKIPSALTIIVGVSFVAIFITWIVAIFEPENSWYFWQEMKMIPDNYSDLNSFVTNPDNYNVVTIFLSKNSDLKPFFIDKDNYYVISEITNQDEFVSSVLYDRIQNYNEGLFVANKWYNFGNSNWFVSDDGLYGIGDIAKSFIAGVFDAFGLIFFIIAIGAIIEVLMETEVLKSLVNSMIKGMNNKRLMLIPSLFVLFSLWGTIMGTQEATLALMPIIVPALIVAGFDSATGFLVILVGCTTGIAASILEPFALGTLAAEFNSIWNDPSVTADVGGTIGIGTGILLRIVLFIVYTAIGCLFVTWYGNKVLKNGDSIELKEMIEENKVWAQKSFGEQEHKTLNKKQKLSLLYVGLVLVWMVFALLPWSNWISGLDDSKGWSTFSHMFFFNSLLGHWTFVQLGLLFGFGWFLCAKTFNYKNDQMLNNWKNSLKTFKVVAYILIFSRVTSIILTYSGSADYLATNLFGTLSEGLSAGLLSLSVFPFYVLMAMFIPSMSGLAGITAPIIAPIVKGYGSQSAMLPAIIGILALYPLAQGLVNMTSPTTGLVVAQAEASRTNYARTLPMLLTYAGVIAIVGVSIVSLSFLVI